MVVAGHLVHFEFIIRKSALAEVSPPITGKFDILTEGPNDNGAHFLDGQGLSNPVSKLPTAETEGSFSFDHTFANDGVHEGIHRFTLVYRHIEASPGVPNDNLYIVLGSMLVNVIAPTTEQSTTVDYTT
jgi:hypothetical protein